jgi:hypothetical protein
MRFDSKTYRLNDILRDHILIEVLSKTVADLGLAGGDFGIYRYSGELGYRFSSGGQEVDSDFILQDFGWTQEYYRSFRNARKIWRYR